MPLKIRCPHCQQVMVADDSAAGERVACPACHQPFSVPLPRAAIPDEVARRGGGRICPHCKTEVAPLAEFCQRCLTELSSGRRPPWRQRLRMRPARWWLVRGALVAGGLVVLAAGTAVYRTQTRPPRVLTPPTTRPVAPVAELARQLLEATTPADREQVLRNLAGVEHLAAPAVAAALRAAIETPWTSPQQSANRLAAIELLIRQTATCPPDEAAAWSETLAQCQRDPELYQPSLRARALLGDARVTEELARTWLDTLERQLFLRRLVQNTGADGQPGPRLLLSRLTIELGRLSDAIRQLGQNPEVAVFERVAEAYWESWHWLGQGAGDLFATELFSLARPPETTLRFRPEDVRTPRDVMRRIAERGSADARAGAAMALHTAPQYRTASREVAGLLGELLPQCDARDQQRLTWVLAQLRGRLFGPVPRSHPLEVTAAEVAAAQEWVRPGTRPVLKEPYPTPPQPPYRATPPHLQIEAALWRDLQGNWDSARMAMERWLTSGLGNTPRMRRLLDPAQPQPHYPALAAAMVVAACRNDASTRSQLELWREATDQPAWVRALAYTALGTLDASSGSWKSGWPSGLELGDTTPLERGTPSWSYFGRLLAAGGAGMQARLRDAPGPLPPPAIRTKLLEAAARCAQDQDR